MSPSAPLTPSPGPPAGPADELVHSQSDRASMNETAARELRADGQALAVGATAPMHDGAGVRVRSGIHAWRHARGLHGTKRKAVGECG